MWTQWIFDDIRELLFKEIKPVNPKGNQPWIFIGRTDAEAWILYVMYAAWREEVEYED